MQYPNLNNSPSNNQDNRYYVMPNSPNNAPSYGQNQIPQNYQPNYNPNNVQYNPNNQFVPNLPNNNQYGQNQALPFNPSSNMNQYVNPGSFRGSLNQQYQRKLSQEEHYGGESLADSSRRNFIVKVYTLLTIQLLITSIIGYLGYNNETFKNIFMSTAVIILVSVGLIALSLVISCCTDVFRKYALPLFILFTILMSILVAISICGFQSKVILMTVAITLVLTIALTIFACTTSFDLTGCGVYLMIIGLVMLVFGIVSIFWRDPIVQLIYSCLATILFGIYLVYDTQLVLGKGNFSYTLDDAYLAALQLYIDIIQLFLNLLRIVSYASN